MGSIFDILKTGDKVILYGDFYPQVRTVEKVTKNEIVVRGIRFHKSNGKEIVRRHTAYDHRIKIYSDELASKIEKETRIPKIIDYLNCTDFNLCSDETLEKLYNILKLEEDKRAVHLK